MDKKLWNIKRVYECSDVVVVNDLLKADWRILAIYIKECRPVYCLGKME